MFKILKYSFFELFRSKWNIFYFLFFFIISNGLIYFSGDLAKSAISLMNIILFLCSLIGLMFGTIYYYNSKEFILLLLAQPIARKSIFLGHFLGMNFSLCLAFTLGTLIPFSIYGVFYSSIWQSFLILILNGIFLTTIFSGFSYYISMKNDNKLLGFGLSILIWLFFSIIYDGLLMTALLMLSDYPLENFALVSIMLNPIDISRILIMLNLDVSALMGYTGAIFKRFFGSGLGVTLSFSLLIIWSLLPIFLIKKIAIKKDF